MKYKLKLYTGEDADLERVMKRLSKRWPHLKKRLKEALQTLEEDPYSGEPLKGRYQGFWTYRIGDWRIIYAQLVSSRKLPLTSLHSPFKHASNLFFKMSKGGRTSSVTFLLLIALSHLLPLPYYLNPVAVLRRIPP